MKFSTVKNKITLVTGGTGLVGNALQRIMPDAIYLSSKDCDLTDQRGVFDLFQKIKPEVVCNLSAHVGGIQENIKCPAEFFDDNVLMNTFVLRYAHEFGCKRFIGMLSTCVYPDRDIDGIDFVPYTENMLHEGSPTKTNFSYGIAKRAAACQIDAYNQQYGTRYNYIIPSNIYGIGDKYDEARSHFVGALIKKIHDAKTGGADHITLFGDGTPKRQFVNSESVAQIIKSCIDNDITESFNIAPDENLSTKTIAECALAACDAAHLKIIWDNTKPNGQMNKAADNSRMKSMFPDLKFIPLINGIRETYKHYEKFGK